MPLASISVLVRFFGEKSSRSKEFIKISTKRNSQNRREKNRINSQNI